MTKTKISLIEDKKKDKTHEQRAHTDQKPKKAHAAGEFVIAM